MYWIVLITNSNLGVFLPWKYFYFSKFFKEIILKKLFLLHSKPVVRRQLLLELKWNLKPITLYSKVHFLRSRHVRRIRDLIQSYPQNGSILDIICKVLFNRKAVYEIKGLKMHISNKDIKLKQNLVPLRKPVIFKLCYFL